MGAREFTYYVPAEQHEEFGQATVLLIRTAGPAADAVTALSTRMQ